MNQYALEAGIGGFHNFFFTVGNTANFSGSFKIRAERQKKITSGEIMKHISAILALMILLTVGLACSDSGSEKTTGDNAPAKQPTNQNDSSKGVTVEYITMKNADDETVTSFKPSDRVQKIAVQLNSTGVGKVKGVFTAVNAGGEKNFKMLEKEVELGTMMNTATFTMSLTKDFPVGDYKFDFYSGDKLIKTHNYKVQ